MTVHFCSNCCCCSCWWRWLYGRIRYCCNHYYYAHDYRYTFVRFEGFI